MRHVDERLEKPIGIFGLTHGELLSSEWVNDDILAVKVTLEVMDDSSTCSEPVKMIHVPPPCITSNLLSFLEDCKCTDTTFVVDGQRIQAHSQILAARSEVFERELNGGMREASSKVIEIIDVDAVVFVAFLRFLYTDDFAHIEVALNKKATGVSSEANMARSSSSNNTSNQPNSCVDMLQSILSISHKYQVPRLRLWCEQKLVEHISIDRVCSILCQAHLYEAKELESACLNFIADKMVAVASTSGFANLSMDWSEIMLKITLHQANFSQKEMMTAIAAHDQSKQNRSAQQRPEEPVTGSPKRRRVH